MTPEDRSAALHQEADEAERVAATVSYAPDKARLTALAGALRRRAQEAHQSVAQAERKPAR